MIINVFAIRLHPNRNHLSTELMKYWRCSVIGSTIGAIDHNLQSFEIKVLWKSGFAKLNVAPCGIIQSKCLANFVGADTAHRFLELRLNLKLRRIGELVALAIKKLDAVIVIGVMRRRDHHSSRQAQCFGEISDPRRWHRSTESHINTCGREPRLQSCFKEIT